MSETSAGLFARVRLLNDDLTPMEFVVELIERVFGKDREAAERIMLEVHHNGIATCGLYPHDLANAKVAEVLKLASQQGHPLQCIAEPSRSI
jgi:ATP-dependent Clp protease adapter protein ClpS